MYLEDPENFPTHKGNFQEFAAFNLLYGTIDKLTYLSNRKDNLSTISEGIHILSNASLNTPWPKAKNLRKGLERLAANRGKNQLINELLILLQDESIALAEDLPDTGFGGKIEKFLSPIFIKGEEYGSRSSTVIVVDINNYCTFVEKTYEPEPLKVTYEFKLQ